MGTKTKQNRLIRIRPSIVALAILAVFNVACLANRPALTCPGKGGPAWTQVRSPHFVVKTELPVDAAKEIAADVETSRAALMAAMGAPPDGAATPVEVVVFERAVDFEVISDRRDTGFFFSQLGGDLELQRVILMTRRLDTSSRTTLQHELVHEIVARRNAHVPWWMEEGLAELYSTVRIEHGEIIVGEPPRDVGFRGETVPVAEKQRSVPKIWIPASDAPSLNNLLSVEIQRGLDEIPDSDHLLYARACILRRLGRAVEAGRDIRLLLQGDANNPRYLLLDLDAAVTAYNEATKAKDQVSSQARRKDLAAKVDRMKAIAATPAQRTETVLALLLLERMAEARVLARKAVEMDPSCDICFVAHAVSLYAEGRLQEARAAAQRALALVPEGAPLTELEELFAQIDKALEAEKAATEHKLPAP